MSTFTSQKARELISLGFALFPVHGMNGDYCTCGNNNCSNRGKHPATLNGLKDATKDIEELKALWNGRKNLNGGVATGEASNIFVIDVDSEEGFKALEERGGLPNTFTVNTHKGKHFYFQYPNEKVITKTKILDSVDVRGDGGYVVAPYSLHQSGTQYEIDNVLEEFAVAPDWILDLVCVDRIKKETHEPRQMPASLNLTTQDGWSYDDVKAHLDHIHPDLNYDEWIQVGMALKAEGHSFELWDAWSSKGAKYDPHVMSNHWNSFKGKGVTYGTVVHLAKQGGWKPESVDFTRPLSKPLREESFDPETGEIIEQQENTSENEDVFETFRADEAEPDLVDRDFVEDYLRENEISVIYGEPNCGKTFFTLDMAMHVALGKQWNNKQIDQGAVLYAALEGGYGIIDRIKAFRKHHEIKDPFPMEVIPTTINMMDKETDLPKLYNTIVEAQKRLGDIKLIVIDTLARAMVGANENSSEDMGVFVDHATKLKNATGAHILLVHHSGKDKTLGMRGSSALKGAIDTEIELTREKQDLVTKVTVIKQKEMEKEKPTGFSLEPVSLGFTDRRKKERITCVVKQEDAPITEYDERMNPHTQFFYDCLLQAIHEYGRVFKPYSASEQVKGVYYKDIAKILTKNGYKQIASDDADEHEISQKTRSMTFEVRSNLKSMGKINFDNNNVWCNI